MSNISIETAREWLQEYEWHHPSDYAGHSPDKDYCVLSVNRDSDCVSRSNWIVGCKILESLDQIERDKNPDYESTVYTFRASHWGCGWVEYLIVERGAPEHILIEAAEMVGSLSEYPVLDESHWSDLEYDEITDYWGTLSIRERAEYCESLSDLFASRRGFPERAFDNLRDGWE